MMFLLNTELLHIYSRLYVLESFQPSAMIEGLAMIEGFPSPLLSFLNFGRFFSLISRLISLEPFFRRRNMTGLVAMSICQRMD